ncbi:protocadherin gamma-A5-like [Silurus meridionalis]|nr:protocadherin gamma-A5-like [Silurus meridionalis]
MVVSLTEEPTQTESGFAQPRCQPRWIGNQSSGFQRKLSAAPSGSEPQTPDHENAAAPRPSASARGFPARFSGKGEELGRFLRSIVEYAEEDFSQFPSERAKIAFCVSLLSGDALSKTSKLWSAKGGNFGSAFLRASSGDVWDGGFSTVLGSGPRCFRARSSIPGFFQVLGSIPVHPRTRGSVPGIPQTHGSAPGSVQARCCVPGFLWTLCTISERLRARHGIPAFPRAVRAATEHLQARCPVSSFPWTLHERAEPPQTRHERAELPQTRHERAELPQSSAEGAAQPQSSAEGAAQPQSSAEGSAQPQSSTEGAAQPQSPQESSAPFIGHEEIVVPPPGHEEDVVPVPGREEIVVPPPGCQWDVVPPPGREEAPQKAGSTEGDGSPPGSTEGDVSPAGLHRRRRPQVSLRAKARPQVSLRAKTRPQVLLRAKARPQVLLRAKACPQVFLRSTARLQVPRRLTSSLQVPRRSTARLQVPRRAKSGLQVPRRAKSGLQVPRRAKSGLQVPPRTTSGLQVRHMATSGLQVPPRTTSGLQVFRMATSGLQVPLMMAKLSRVSPRVSLRPNALPKVPLCSWSPPVSAVDVAQPPVSVVDVARPPAFVVDVARPPGLRLGQRTVQVPRHGGSQHFSTSAEVTKKAYNRVSREELWYCMKKSGVSEKYVMVVQGMFEDIVTAVKCAVGTTDWFNAEVGLHQGLALSPFLFAAVTDRLTDEVRQDSPWTMMFVDDIVICGKSREQVEESLEWWRYALERRGMKVSRRSQRFQTTGQGSQRFQTTGQVGDVVKDLGLEPKRLLEGKARIFAASGRDYLQLDREKGHITVKERMDRETLCSSSTSTCSISFEIIVENPIELYRVIVEILDVNDNSPAFPRGEMKLEISESAARPAPASSLLGLHPASCGPGDLASPRAVSGCSLGSGPEVSLERLVPLRHFLAAWQALPDVSWWVLHTVERAYLIQFGSPPPHFYGDFLILVGSQQALVMEQEEDTLLRRWAIEVASIRTRVQVLCLELYGSQAGRRVQDADPRAGHASNQIRGLVCHGVGVLGKSVLSPLQRTTYLSVIWDSPAHIVAILTAIRKVREGQPLTVEQFQTLLDLPLEVIPLGLLYMRPLHWWLRTRGVSWRGNPLRTIKVTQRCLRALDVWRDPLCPSLKSLED